VDLADWDYGDEHGRINALAIARSRLSVAGDRAFGTLVTIVCRPDSHLACS
jgi:hypothetical protein